MKVTEKRKISIFPEFEPRDVEPASPPAITTTPSLLVDVGSQAYLT
jgi:hypothetical protein